MRTITHSGVGGATFDFSVVTTEAYAFVFAPNTMVITLGSGYDATQEVTIAANGITLKRNCLNRVVTFDLSAIFESWFATSEFAVPATTDSDPFWKEPFNVVVTADTGESENVHFSLRWGARQFDEASIPAAITFPFWAELPLNINTDKCHDAWELTGGVTASGTGVDMILVEATADFAYIVKQASTTVQTTSYKVNDCPSDGHYLRWVDAHGRLWHFNFYRNREQSRTVTTANALTIPVYPLSIEDSVNGVKRVTQKEKQRTFTCFASVDEDIYEIVASVVASPKVEYWTNPKWVGVTIPDMTEQPVERWTKDIEFTVELPKDFIQRR
jgi:hypothetical protein